MSWQEGDGSTVSGGNAAARNSDLICCFVYGKWDRVRLHTCVPFPEPGPPSTKTMVLCCTCMPALDRSMSCAVSPVCQCLAMQVHGCRVEASHSPQAWAALLRWEHMLLCWELPCRLHQPVWIPTPQLAKMLPVTRSRVSPEQAIGQT